VEAKEQKETKRGRKITTLPHAWENGKDRFSVLLENEHLL
jgi:hypothetical protein